MELKKNFIGSHYHSKYGKILVCEENKELLSKIGADVFEVSKPKKTKYKGIKEDKPLENDDKDTEINE